MIVTMIYVFALVLLFKDGVEFRFGSPQTDMILGVEQNQL